MNRYTSRIKNLRSKLLTYVSQSEFCAVRDYFKHLFDECEKPEDFEEQFQEYLTLDKKWESEKDADAMAKLDEMTKNEEAILYKYFYQLFNDGCENCPNGEWEFKWVRGSGFFEKAKKYAEERKVKR